MNKRMKAHYDVVIIGSGAAGLTLALHLPNHLSVAMICKESPLESSSYYAQGGVAAVLDEYDSIQAHVDDTLIAGDGLCDLDAVSFVVEQSPSIIDWLVDLGVDFDTRVSKSGRAEFHLTQEGGHRHRRVVHAADATGREITERLSNALGRRSNTDFLTNHIAIDLITGNQLGESNKAVRGVYTLDLNTLSAHTFS